MKREVRFLGVDDGPFTFKEEAVRVVGVVTRGASYVEGVLTTECRIDGDDATQRVVAMVRSTRFRPTLRAIFLNGVTLGGFNVVDLAALSESTGLPVVSVVRSRPRRARTEDALRKHLADAAARMRLLDAQEPREVSNGRFQVWCSWRGIDAEEVAPLLQLATVRGAIPEPIRLAHVIASGVQRGESRGPA